LLPKQRHFRSTPYHTSFPTRLRRVEQPSRRCQLLDGRCQLLDVVMLAAVADRDARLRELFDAVALDDAMSPQERS
jgi:hypothetical protein